MSSRQLETGRLVKGSTANRAVARKRAAVLALAGAVAMQATPWACADNVLLNGNDAAGSSSFNSAGNWSSGAAPVAGNTYEVAPSTIANFVLRTPADANSYTFAGDSLELDAQSRLLLKGTAANVYTINNFILNGGLVDLTSTTGTVGTLAGNITLNTGTTSTILAESGFTLTLSSLIGGLGNVNFGGSNVSAGFGATTAVTGTGTVVIGGAQNYTGATNLSAGTLTLNGAGGALGATSALSLFGGTLNLDSVGSNNNDRINDAASIFLSGGNLVLKGNAAGTTETVGAISGLGGSTVTVSFTTASSSLTAASLNHLAGGGSILVNGVGLGQDGATAAGRFFVNTAPTLVGTTAPTAGINSAAKNTQIVSFLVGEATVASGGLGTATGVANTFVTYNAATGFRPLNPTDEFTQNAITTGNNTRITAATTASTGGTINSLLIAGGDLTITDGQTLTDTSGAVLFASTNAIKPSTSTGTLAFGTAEGMITTASGFTGTINAVLTGSGGVTFSGAGTTTVSTGTVVALGGITGAISKAGSGTTNINTTTATFLSPTATSAINVEGGTLVFADATSTNMTNPLGTGLITITPGATLQLGLAGNTASTFANAITIANANSSGVATVSVTSGATPFAGAVTFAPGSYIPTLLLQNSNGTTAALTLTGGITGVGNVELRGTSTGSPITISTGTVNNTGWIANVGTNAGTSNASTATISAAIGSNVGNITQAGTSIFTITGAITLGGDRSYGSSGTGQFNLQNITGTATAGNLQTITLASTSTGNTFLNGIVADGSGGGKVAINTVGTSTGLFAFVAANTYSGGTVLNPGTFSVPQANSTGTGAGVTNGSFGTGLLTLAGGALRASTTPTSVTVGNTTTITGDTTFFSAGANTDHDLTFSGPVTLVGSRTFTVNTSPILSQTGVFFTGNLAGTNPTDGLTKAGTGTLVLAGTSTYGGTTAINTGTLEYATPASVAPGAVNVAAPATIALAVGTGGFATTDLDRLFNSVTGTPVTLGSNANVNVNSASFIGIDPTATSLTYSLSAASTHGLAKIGPNTLVLNTANNYSGGTALYGGTLSLGDPGALGSGTLTGYNGTITAAADLGGANKLPNALTLAGAVTIGGTNNIDFGGTVTGGTQVLTVTNTGTTTLSGSTTAATVLKTLILSGGATSNFVIGAGGLSISNTGGTAINATAGGTISGGTLTLSSNTATDGPDVVTAAGTTLTINSVIASSFSGNTGPFEELTPGGTIVLTGVNTYGGATILNSSGVLSVGTIGDSGVAGNAGKGSSFIFGGGTLRYTGAASTTNRVLNFSGTTTGGAVDASGTGLIEFTSTAAIASGAGTKTITLTGTGSGQLDGVIQNNGGTNLTNVSKTGTGTWILKAAETYTGTTSITGGNLQIPTGSSLGNTGITVSGAGTFSPVTGSTIGATATLTVSGTGTLNLADGTIGTLTIAAPNTATGLTLTSGSLSFDLNTTTSDLISVVKAAETGFTSLNLIGTPTLGKTYTLISASDAGSTLAAGNYGIGTTASGFTYSITATATSLQVTALSAAAAGGSLFWTGAAGSGAWTATNGTTTNFAEAYSGGTSNLLPTSTSNVFFTAANVAAPVTSSLTQGVTINSLNFTGTGTPAATNAVAIAGPGQLTLLAASGFTDQNAAAYAAGTGLVVQAGSAAHTISAPVALGATQTWEIDNAPANALVVSGVVSGAFGLNKTGPGTLRLGAANTVVANTFTGPINISGGLVSYTGTGASGDPAPLGAGTKTITLTNGGGVQVTFALSNPTASGKSFVIGTGGGVFDVQTGGGLQLDDAGQLSGTGDLTVQGAGTGLVFLNNQPFNFSGNVNVNSATLRLGTNSVLGTTTGRTITVASGAVLDTVSTTGTIPLSINLSGSGIGGTGALISSGTGSLAGNITLAANTSIGGAGTLTLSGVISGAFDLTKAGTGTTTLTGANTYTGNTFLAAGTLNAGVADVAGTSGAFGNGGNITFTGGALGYSAASAGIDYTARIKNSTGAVALNTNGVNVTLTGVIDSTNTGGFTKAGTGTLTLGGTASNTFTGTTTVQNGSLVLAKSNGINGANTAVALSGGTVALTTTANGNIYYGSATAPTLNHAYDNQINPLAVLDFTNAISHQYVELLGNDQTLAGLIAPNQNAVIENEESQGGASTTSTLTLNVSGTNSYSYLGFMRDHYVAPGVGILNVTKSGTGTQVLGGNQIIYTGPTTINAGKLGLNAASAFASPVVFSAGSAGILEIQSATQSVAGLSTVDVSNSGDVVQNNAGTNSVLTVNTTTNNFFGGVLQDNATSNTLGLAKSGTGSLTLAGNNTFSGVLTLTGGTLQLQANAGNTVGGVSTVAGAAASGRLATANGTTLQLRSDSSVSFAGTDGIGSLNAATVTYDVNQLTAAGSNNTITLSGTGPTPIGNAVTINVTGGNGYNLALGTLQNVTGTATNLTLNPTTASVNLAGYRNNYSTASASNSTLTLGGTSTGNIVSGPIVNQAAGSLGTGNVAVTKSNTSTFTLTAAETYTGATTVSAGTLALGNGGSLGATAVSVNGGTFAVIPGVNGATTAVGSTLTMAAGSAFSMTDGATSTATVSGAATLAPATGASTLLTFDLNGLSNGVSDLLNITGAGTVGAGKATIFLNGIGGTATAGNSYTIITAGSGLNPANFTLGNANNRVVFGNTAYLASLSGNATSETVTLGDGGAAFAYFTGKVDPTTLNATSGGGANTNFSADGAGTVELGAQPNAFTDVFFAASNVPSATPVTINSLGMDYAVNTLNFTSAAPAFTINNAGGNTVTLSAGLNVAGGSAAQTVNVPVVLAAAQTFTNASANPLTLGGTITNGGFTLTTAGPGNISFGGAISGAGGLTAAGAGTTTLAATNGYTGTTTVGSGILALTADQSLTGGLTFGTAPLATTSGAVDLTAANATFGGTLLVQTNSSTANAITVGSGKTLTLNGNVVIGTVPVAPNAVSKLTIGGGGTLNVATAAGGLFQVGGNTITTSSVTPSLASTLDLTGLAAANINVSTTGTVRVGQPTSTNASGNQSTLLLPTPVVATGTPVTSITAANLNVGDNGGLGGGAGQINSLVFGTGLTTLKVDTVNVGIGGRDLGSVTFAAGNGTLNLRAANGTGRTTFNVGSSVSTTGVATGAGTTGDVVDLTGHDSNLLIGTLTVGNQARIVTNSYDFKFNTGVLDATGVNIGFDTLANGNGTNTLTSTLAIGGGTVTIGTGAVSLGSVTDTSTGAKSIVGNFNVTGGTVNIGTTGVYSVRLGNNTAPVATATDTFSVTGGTVTLAGDIVTATTARTTSTVTLDGGTLDLSGKNIGGTAAITNLNFLSGTLKNVGQINNGAGLTKTTAGTLALAGTNTYTGTTTVSAGRLQAGAVNALSAGSAVNLADVAGAALDLSGNNNTIASLTGGGANGGNVLLGAGTLTVGDATSPTYAGVISGTGGVTKVGAGTQTLTGVSTYTGDTIVNNGTLTIASPGAISSTNVSVVGGAVLNVNAGAKVSTSTNLAANGTVNFSGPTPTIDTLNGTSTGQVVLNAAVLTVSNGGTYAGQIKDGAAPGSLVTAGGILTLTGNNLYSNGTTVGGSVGNPATLFANNVAGSATGSGSVNVNALGTLLGTGTVSGPVAINSGGTISAGTGVSPTSNVGKLTTGGETWKPDGTYIWKLTDAGAATQGGTVNVGNGTGWDQLSVAALDLSQLGNGVSGGDPFTIKIVGSDANLSPTGKTTFAIVTSLAAINYGDGGFDPSRFVIDTSSFTFTNPSDHGFTLQGDANTLDVVYNAVPEPTVMALLGLSTLGLLRRRRRPAAAARTPAPVAAV